MHLTVLYRFTLKLLSVALSSALLLAPGMSFAHGGGLDSHGCHHNRKAGGYHCHRGEFKGQHFASKEEMLKAKKEDK